MTRPQPKSARVAMLAEILSFVKRDILREVGEESINGSVVKGALTGVEEVLHNFTGDQSVDADTRLHYLLNAVLIHSTYMPASEVFSRAIENKVNETGDLVTAWKVAYDFKVSHFDKWISKSDNRDKLLAAWTQDANFFSVLKRLMDQ